MLAYMKREQPEIDIIRLAPFPFGLTQLQSALVGGNVVYFVNAAAMGKDSESLERPYEYLETNTFGVVKQLEMIRKFSPQTRYVNLGSVYERAKNTPYATSKRAARDIIKSYRESFGLYAVQTYLGFTEYYHRDPSYLSKRITGGVARIALAVKNGTDFEPIFLENIDQKFSWTWAEDVADGLWRMLNQDKSHRQMREDGIDIKPVSRIIAQTPREHLLSSGETHTVRAFVEKAFAAAGFEGCFWDREEPIAERGHLETYEWVNTSTNTGHSLVKQNPIFLRPSDVTYLHGDASRARTELGWSPKVSFDDLVTRMVQNDLKEVGL